MIIENQFLTIILLIGVLILILPSFLKKNSNIKFLLNNLFIWLIIILILIIIMYFFNII